MLNPEIKKIYDLTAHQNRTLLSPDQFVKLFDGKQIVIECIITNDDDDLTVHWQMPPSKANVQYNHEKKLVSVNGINICTWLEASAVVDAEGSYMHKDACGIRVTGDERLADNEIAYYRFYFEVEQGKRLYDYRLATGTVHHFDGRYVVAPSGYIFTCCAHLQSSRSFLRSKFLWTPLIARKQERGHLYVQLTASHQKRAHPYRLQKIIASVFLPNEKNLSEVNHMDLDVTNNSVENLEWCGRRYNLKYSTVFHSIHEALPEINCHEWVLVCRDITNKILNGGSKKHLISVAIAKLAATPCQA